MNLYIINAFIILVLTLADAARINYRNRDASARYSDTFGARTVDRKSYNQSKRETSLSYAATNIDSKEGTRVKTITVIKNHSGKNGNSKLAINPALHKNEEWANAFRDNFDSYGRIPDVPDIDDLFGFVKKNTHKNDNGNSKKITTPKPKPKEPEMKPKPKEVEIKEPTKPVEEPASSDEAIEQTTTPEPVVKIKGDAELIPTMKKNQTTSARSQSLGLDKKYTREALANANYSSASVEETTTKNIYFEKYIQLNVPTGYNYPKPCPKSGKSVVTIKNPSSGRTYDITVEEDSPGVPYIAPSITKKPPTQMAVASQYNNTTSVNPPNTYARPSFPINSILPPLQSNQNQNGQQQQTGYTSTSQRPYIAPNIRNNNNFNGYDATTLRPLYGSDLNIYRGNTLLLGVKRRNSARTRGLFF